MCVSFTVCVSSQLLQGTVDTKIMVPSAENPELSKVPPVKLVGQTVALPATRNSACLVSVFSVGQTVALLATRNSACLVSAFSVGQTVALPATGTLPV